MLPARQSVNHAQMLETLTSPSNPMGNHSMPNAPVLAQDAISTNAKSRSTQARMSNHTHKGWRLEGRWTAEIIAPFCSAMLEFSVSTVYKMPSYRISLFDVRLMRLPMYESAVFGPRPLPIVAERDSNPLFLTLSLFRCKLFALERSTYTPHSDPTQAFFIAARIMPCARDLFSSHRLLPSSLFSSTHEKTPSLSPRKALLPFSHGAPYLPLISINVHHKYITTHHIYLSPLGKRSHWLGCIVKKYLSNLHIYHCFRLDLLN